jgi:hypothetical protein
MWGIGLGVSSGGKNKLYYGYMYFRSRLKEIIPFKISSVERYNEAFDRAR